MRYRMYSQLAAAALLGVAAACSDAPTPTQSAHPGPQLLLLGAGDTLVTRFTYNPAVGGTYHIGDHKISMPAGSVCDPARSTYGPTEWDKACVALASPIEITAKSWLNADGHPQIDFSPSLRFAPEQTVKLYFRDKDASNTLLSSKLTILWSAGPGLPGIDESILDPSLKPKVLPEAGLVMRRIKHFSGYLVATRTATSESVELY